MERWHIELKGKYGNITFEDWTPEDERIEYDSLEKALDEATHCPAACAVSVFNSVDGARVLVQGQRGRDVAGRYMRTHWRDR